MHAKIVFATLAAVGFAAAAPGYGDSSNSAIATATSTPTGYDNGPQDTSTTLPEPSLSLPADLDGVRGKERQGPEMHHPQIPRPSSGFGLHHHHHGKNGTVAGSGDKQSCSAAGKIICSADGKKFGLCDGSSAIMMACSDGTECHDGQIQATDDGAGAPGYGSGSGMTPATDATATPVPYGASQTYGADRPHRSGHAHESGHAHRTGEHRSGDREPTGLPHFSNGWPLHGGPGPVVLHHRTSMAYTSFLTSVTSAPAVYSASSDTGDVSDDLPTPTPTPATY